MIGRNGLLLPQWCWPQTRGLLGMSCGEVYYFLSRRGVWDLFGGDFLMRPPAMREWTALIWPRKHCSDLLLWAWLLPLLDINSSDWVNLCTCLMFSSVSGRAAAGVSRWFQVTESVPVQNRVRHLVGLTYVFTHTGVTCTLLHLLSCQRSPFFFQ